MSQTGTASSGGNHSDNSRTARGVQAEARLHPFEHTAVDPWFGGSLGFMAITDSVQEYGPNDEYLDGASATQFGPAGGVALGMDFPVASFLALGFELRGGLQSFGHSPPKIKDELFAPDYGTLAFMSLGLGGTFLIDPGS